jgi:hypothetical protein
LDPELDLGCLPYRERFASGAPDERSISTRAKKQDSYVKVRNQKKEGRNCMKSKGKKTRLLKGTKSKKKEEEIV